MVADIEAGRIVGRVDITGVVVMAEESVEQEVGQVELLVLLIDRVVLMILMAQVLTLFYFEKYIFFVYY